MKNILYAGFKGANNSSSHVVNSLDGNKILLTNSFGGISRDIETLNSKYEKIIMYGLDKTLKDTIRFEKTAKSGHDLIYSTADLSEYISKAERMNLNYTISEHPTHYLCNEAYYRMMKKMDCSVLFVHIPTLKNMSTNFFEKLITVFN